MTTEWRRWWSWTAVSLGLFISAVLSLLIGAHAAVYWVLVAGALGTAFLFLWKQWVAFLSGSWITGETFSDKAGCLADAIRTRGSDNETAEWRRWRSWMAVMSGLFISAVLSLLIGAHPAVYWVLVGGALGTAFLFLWKQWVAFASGSWITEETFGVSDDRAEEAMRHP